MTLRDDLIAAKALIDTPEKWGRGRFFDAFTGKTCIRGACAFATGSNVLSAKAGVLEDALSRVRDPLNRGRHNLACFNDDPATTHADIMDLFDRAIAAATEDTP